MLAKKAVFSLVLCLTVSGFTFSQDRQNSVPLLSRLQDGMLLYSQGYWEETVETLTPVLESPNKTLAAEALFWIALAELSAGNYEKTLADMAALETLDPESNRLGELCYHKGRALFYLGQYDQAIFNLMKYADSFPADEFLNVQDISKKAAALYWIGESLFAMGQFDRAADVFMHITVDYPQSPKYEASSYRVALIGQKKVETELLDLLKWSHEESLRIMEEYQRRERAYDQAILSYQRRINDMLKDTRLSDLETSNAQYQQQLATAEDRIRNLETRLTEMAGMAVSQRNADNSPERLQVLRSSAESLREELLRAMADFPTMQGPEK